MFGIRKTTSLGLCSGLVLALAIALAPGTAAAQTLVLKASGEEIPNGALVNVATAETPEYSFKTKLTISGTTAPAEEEIECESYLEQAKIEHEAATGTWRLVEPHPVEICEGTWLTEDIVHNQLTLTSEGKATDEASFELARSAEEVRAEERLQAEHGEPVNPREPLRCNYTSTATGSFKKTAKKPLLVKFKGKATPVPVAGDAGCSSKATWKGGFTLSYKGEPVFASEES